MSDNGKDRAYPAAIKKASADKASEDSGSSDGISVTPVMVVGADGGVFVLPTGGGEAVRISSLPLKDAAELARVEPGVLRDAVTTAFELVADHQRIWFFLKDAPSNDKNLFGKAASYNISFLA